MKRLLIGAFVFFLIFSGGFAWWKNGSQAKDPKSKEEKIFVVQKGQGIKEIAKNLKNEDLIKDPTVFFILVKTLGLDQDIQAGDFRLSPSWNAEKIAKELTHGTLDVWVTIQEGKRAEEIAQILKEKIPSFDESWNNLLVANEGYLFPDTYLIPRTADINLIISIMRNNFDKKFISISKETSISQKEAVIIASLIEREAKLPEDRPLVASVIFNRLEISMPLQIDATIQYALGEETDGKWWKKNLTKDDLQINSPYNTYRNTGLPPGPISNPGLDVLRAVLNPAKTNYLYYISDKLGKNHYAKTLEEHNANIKKYGL